MSSLSLPSGARREQSRMLAWAAILYILTAFGVDLLARGHALSLPVLTLYGLLSVTLATRYLLWTREPSFILPPQKVLPMLLVSAGLLFLIALLLNGPNMLYFYLVALEGYITLSMGRRRWGVLWVIGIVALAWLSNAIFIGWGGAILVLLHDIPGYVLIIVLFELLIREKAHHDQMALLVGELTEAHKQLQAHVAQAEALAVAEERTRVAREIHDTLGHTMTALDVQLELIARLPEERREQQKEAIEQAKKLVKQGLLDVRRAVKALRPDALETLSLPEAIGNLVEEFRKRNHLDVTWEIEGEILAIPFPAVVPLYRAAQEALTNVSRHARATAVHVRLSFAPDSVTLLVEDNGQNGGQPPSFGFGLKGLEERALALGGTFHACPRPGGGFRVEMRLPR